MPDLVIMGSHCVALDVVLGVIADAGIFRAQLAVGSMGGVAAAQRGECDLAPVHLLDPRPAKPTTRICCAPGLALVPGWRRMQGFVYRPGDPRFAGLTAQPACTRHLPIRHCLMVSRNAGAGTRILIDRLLAGARPPGYGNQPRSHNAVAAAVAQGRADWGIAIGSVASLYGLAFLPLMPEHYDFLLVESRRDRPAVQAFLAALGDEEVRERIRGAGMIPADD